MKLIEFRAKNIKYQWNYGLLCNDPDKDSAYEWFISNKAGKPYAFGAIEKTIGQYIGLYDKFGTCVYVGDIILYKGAKGVVFYDDNSAMFMVNFELLRSLYSFDSIDDDFSVIGNIHDNPELCSK